MEKVQWNSIDKKQNGLKYSKKDKSSTLPRWRPLTDLHEPLHLQQQRWAGRIDRDDILTTEA